MFAAVSDGAGSAARSDEGAAHLVRTVVKACRDHAQVDTPPRVGAWRSVVEEAVRTARNTLPASPQRIPAARGLRPAYRDAGRAAEAIRTARVATVRDPERAPFHATLVGAVVHAERGGFFFHIGDGAGIACQVPDWDEAVAVSPPANGAYAGETYFFTLPAWRQHLRFTPIPHNADLITLMTDGATAFAMRQNPPAFDPNFIEPVTRYLDQVDPASGAEALSGTLRSDDVQTITRDDVTFLWARRL
jgi:hypothetical protein